MDARQGHAAKLGDSGGSVAVDEQTQHLLFMRDELLHELSNPAVLLRPNAYVSDFGVARATNPQFCHKLTSSSHPIAHLTGSVTGPGRASGTSSAEPWQSWWPDRKSQYVALVDPSSLMWMIRVEPGPPPSRSDDLPEAALAPYDDHSVGCPRNKKGWATGNPGPTPLWVCR